MTDFIESAPIYDEHKRLLLWYFNLRSTFVGHPEARISVGPKRTEIRTDEGKLIIGRAFGSDIDQNNWIGRMQANQLLLDYERAIA